MPDSATSRDMGKFGLYGVNYILVLKFKINFIIARKILSLVIIRL